MFSSLKDLVKSLLSVLTPSARTAPLRLEALEIREVPANLVWTADGDGVFWSDADNWEVFANGQLTGVHQTPSSSDTLYFGSLGGPNVSSTADFDVTVTSIIQNNTYTGDLNIDGDVTLTVSSSFYAYGEIDLSAALSELDAGTIYLIGGTITAGTILGENNPLTTDVLDMTSDATLTVEGDGGGGEATLKIGVLYMGSDTTFELTASEIVVTLDGTVSTCTGTVSLVAESELTITGNYYQSSGDLFLNDDCILTIEGGAAADLSGHTVIEGDVDIVADTVKIDGTGLMEYTSLDAADTLTFDGDLEIQSGTFEFTEIGGVVEVTGNFSVFIGTVIMNVGIDGMGGAISNVFLVDGSVDLSPDVGGPP
ncbi:MAG: hypothetical protein L0241_19015 [Planctomycetia bacterium]|nr:hypothetical protein [Planctomycetia bacterium]